MPQFRYVARNTEGKLVDGVIECNDRAAAIFQVERERYVPIRIEPLSSPTVGTAPATAASARSSAVENVDSKRVAPTGPVHTLSPTHLYLFTEQLGHLLSAGMTLDEALGILVRRLKHPRLGGLSQVLHQALIDGRSLSQAMREFPRIFNPLYVNMVSAGEASGALPEILRRLIAHLSDVKALRDRVQQALIYPALLVVAGVGLIIVFMTMMVPKLEGLFEKTGQPLPTATRILVQANEIVTGYWWAGLLGAGAVYGVFKVFTRSQEGRRTWDAFVWRLPVLSLVIRHRYYAQFSRTLGTLVGNGVTLLRALELLEEISGNEFIRQRMVEVRKAVVDGATLSTALAEQKIFPELFCDMMAVGEQTGKFPETMQMIADVYERELDRQVKITSALIPPLIMLVIAIVVGLVVYGILSAVFGVTQGLRPGGR